MSKKIVIDEMVLWVVHDTLDFLRKRLERHIRGASKETEEKRVSVLEWHSVSEKPNQDRQLIIRLDDGKMTVDRVRDYETSEGGSVWGFERYLRRHVIEWAYLPEEQSTN